MNIIVKYWPLALVAFSGLAGWIAVDQWKERLREEGAARIWEARADTAETEKQIYKDQADLLRIENDSLNAELVRAVESADSIDQHSSEVIERERERNAELRSQVVQATDSASTEMALDSLEASWQTRVDAERESKEEYRAALFVAQTANIGLQEENSQLRSALEASENANAALRQAAGNRQQRGFLEKWGERVVWMAVGVGVAEAGRKVAGG